MQNKDVNLKAIVALAKNNDAISAAMFKDGQIAEKVVEDWIARLSCNDFQTNLLALLEVQPWARSGLTAVEDSHFHGISEEEVKNLYYHGWALIMRPTQLAG